MNDGLVEEIANAVLYEGYILYPYRASALKNRKRFNFGVVYPSAYAEAQGGGAISSMQTECLVLGGPLTEIEIKVRFLQIVGRVTGELTAPRGGEAPGFHPVGAVEVQGNPYSAWQEASEREVTLPACGLAEIADHPIRHDFKFPAWKEVEPLREERGLVAGTLIRRHELLVGCVEVTGEPAARVGAETAGRRAAGQSLFRVRVGISNLTEFGATDDADEVLMRSLASTHTLLGVREGEFVSLLDPADPFKHAASSCRNVGTFPVLAGEEGRHDTLLSSPIILYDYPQVATESAGQFFDGTEIDEMLALRILTLTDDEKREMGQLDEKTRQLLQRTEALPQEHMMKLHGVLRGLRGIEERR
jgi:hypothetical protein